MPLGIVVSNVTRVTTLAKQHRSELMVALADSSARDTSDPHGSPDSGRG
jgi:hypothetical protein